MTTDRPVLDLGLPGALSAHDNALRVLTDVARAAIAVGASNRSLAVALIRATRGLDLLGRVTEKQADAIALLLGEAPTDEEADNVLTQAIRAVVDEANR